jgi:hypothetical protein
VYVYVPGAKYGGTCAETLPAKQRKEIRKIKPKKYLFILLLDMRKY